MKRQTKTNIQLILGATLSVFGMLMLIASFIVPPLGVIHSSILAAIGEVFTFAGCLLGVDYSYKLKMYKLTQEKGEENIQK